VEGRIAPRKRNSRETAPPRLHLEALEPRVLLDGSLEGLFGSTIDLGNHVTPPAIYGQKFHDLDGDRVRQPDEPGLNGWTIELLDAGSGAVVATRLTTDLDLDSDGQIDPATESGWYWFDNLPPGDYVVREAGQAGWALSAPGLPSFEPHQLLPPQGIPDPDAITTLAVDMDKDGDLDVVTAHEDYGKDNVLQVFINDGEGNFAQLGAYGWSTGYKDHAGQIAAADLDGDGDNDIVALNGDGVSPEVLVFRNSGSGALSGPTAYRTYPSYATNYFLAISDVDNDGDPDILACYKNYKYGHGVSVLKNNGNGTFAPPATYVMGNFDQFALADLNGDGFDDIAMTNFSNRLIALNDGTGAFPTTIELQAGRGDGEARTALADLDGDGDTDLVFTADAPSGGGDALEVWLNDGAANFALAQLALPETAVTLRNLELADLDGDGDADILASDNSDRITTMLNDGTGTFAPGTPIPAYAHNPRQLAAGDFDGDGLPDLAVPYGEDTAILLNRGAAPGGTYRATVQAGSVFRGRDFGNVAHAEVRGQKFNDLDADGTHGPGEPGLDGFLVELVDPQTGDVLATQLTHSEDTDSSGDIDPVAEQGLYAFSGLWPGHYEVREAGRAGFRQSAPGALGLAAPATLDGFRQPEQAVAADFDSDGFADLAVADYAGSDFSQVLFLRNQGDNSFAPPVPILTAAQSYTHYRIAATDADGDGDTDILAADTRTDDLSVFLNDGAGAFTLAGSYPLGLETDLLAVGDLDGDGLSDLVVGNDNTEELHVLLNTAGAFGAPITLDLAMDTDPGTLDVPISLAIADVDSDGNGDILVGVYDIYSFDGQVRFYHGDGQVAFPTTTAFDRTPRRPIAIAAADFDHDGRPEVVVGREYTDPLILTSDGQGGWTQSELPGWHEQDIVPTDLDADGRLDLAMSSGNDLALLLNRGGGTFELLSELPYLDTECRSLVAADFDGDGRPDLAGTTWASDRVLILRNTATHQFTLRSGEEVADADFGNFRPNTIRGTKFHDHYGDGSQDPDDLGLPGWDIFLDLDHDGELTEQATTLESTDVPAYLGEGVSRVASALRVSGLHGVVSDLDVSLEISHPQVDELTAYLVSPLGFKVKLFGGVSGTGPDFSGTTLDDEATTAIADGTSPFTGHFRPEQPLSRFDGLDPNGLWTLEVLDSDETQNHGSLDDWSLTITVAEPWTTTDAQGHYAFRNLPDGTYEVAEVMKPGWEATSPAGGAATVVVAGGQTAVADFGNRELGPPAEVAATLVRVPTTTDANGEVATLPGSEAWVHEWEPFWVELWASTPSSTAYRIAAATLDLAYDTNYLTATAIVHGPAFTADQSGAIDDAAGTVQGVGGRTTLPGIGDDAYVLIARVRFEPGAGDEVPVDPVNRFIGPYGTGLALSAPTLELAGYGAVSATVGATPATDLWALPYDGDDSGVIDQDDFEWYRSAFLTQPGGSEPPYTWWADFDKSGLVDFGDFSYFAPNFQATKPAADLTLPPNFPSAGGGPALAVALANDTGHGGASDFDGITQDPALVGSATDPNGVTAFSVQLNGQFIGSPVDKLADLDPDGSFAFDQADLEAIYGHPLADGLYTLQVQGENGLGNRSNLQFRFTLDRVAPEPPGAPDLVAASDSGARDDDNLTNIAQPVVLVGGETGSTVRVLVDGAEAAQGAANSQLALGPLTEGAHVLTAICLDGAGNESTPSAPLTITVDTHGPAISAALANDTGTSAWDGLTSDPQIDGSIGPEGPLATLEARLTAAVGYVDVSHRLGAGGAFTLDRATLEALNAGPLPEQHYTLRLRATDAAGNPSPILQVAFELDETPPPPPDFHLAPFYDTGTPGDWQTMLPTAALEGQSEAGATIALDGSALSTTADATGHFALDGVALALGENAVTVVASDAAGNTSTSAHTVTREAAPPVAIADPDLAAAIRAQRGLPPGHTLDQADLYLLFDLSADSNLIDDLSGLEHAVNLESLALTPTDFAVAGSLDGLDALTGLEHLETLTLVRAGLTDADTATLAAIAPLRTLDISYNEISDIGPLAALPWLETLRFYGNAVTDISAFAGRPVVLDFPPEGLDDADTVADLAAALHYMPLGIYEYVLNTYDYTPYYGLMKGTDGVLATQAGNDWELAHLLAELFGEAGIATRYVSGTVRADVEDVKNWLGVTEASAASRILRAAEEFGSSSSAYLFRHTWLEARLTVPGGQQEWVGFDPSWKLRDYQAGVPDIVTLVPFDEDGYLSQLRTELPWEWYRDQVADYLKANVPGRSVGDVPYSGRLRQQRVDAIPWELPYTVENRTEYDTYADLAPMAHKTRLTLEHGSTVLFTHTLVLPEMSLEPVVIAFADAGGGQVRPELRVGESVVATGATIAAGSSVELTIEHYDPQYDEWRRDHSYTRTTDQVLAIGFDANQISEAALQRLRAEINEASLAAAAGDPDAMIAEVGDFLTLGVWSYLDDCNRAEDVVAGLTWAVPVRTFVESGIASATPTLYGNETLQTPLMPSGLTLDMAGLARTSLFAVDGFSGVEDPNNDLRNRIMDFNGSAQEHATWEELSNTPAVSTIRSFQLANEAGIPIFEFDSSDAALYIPQLTIAPGTIASIQAELADGGRVTVPRDPTPYHDWDGVGYLVERADGGSAYMISGALNGAASNPFSGAQQAALDAAYAEAVIRQFNELLSGDPVNVANGVVTYDEIDVALPDTGIPLAFARHYDTQSDADLGMGPGWTHSYCDKLTFNPDGSITWTTFRGYLLTFAPDGQGGYVSPPTAHGTLATAGGGYAYHDTSGLIHEWDAQGRLTRITDRFGNTHEMAYDASGRLASVTDAGHPGRNLTFTWNGLGQLAATSDFTGRTWTYAYANGRLAQVTGPSDAQTPAYVVRYEYYADSVRDGLLRRVTAPNGGVTEYDYYANRRAFKVTRPGGYSSHLFYDLSKNETSVVDERGFLTVYTYDDDGNLVAKAYPDGSKETYLWQDGLLKQWTDTTGHSETYQYDAKGNLTRKVDRTGVVTETTYHPDFDKPTAITVAGRTTTYDYDAAGNLIRIEDPAGNVTSRTYDPWGRMLTETRPNGNLTPDPNDYTTTYTYNDAGQVLTIATDLPSLETYTYDARGNTLTHTDPNGHTTTYEYDLRGSLVRVTDPRGFTTTYTYDTIGNKTSITDPQGRTASFDYDVRGLLVRATNPDGTFRTYSYDAAGNLVAERDELGRTTTYDYDARNRATRVVHPDGAAETNIFDTNGNLVATVDALGNRTEFSYDPVGRLTHITDPLGHTTTRTYDDHNDLITVAAPGGATTTYAYDAVHRVTSLTDAEGNTTTYAYDADGNLVSLTDPRGFTTTYAYDVLDRQVQMTDPLGGTTTRTYDPVGNLLTLTDPNGHTASYHYDAGNLLTQITDLDGATTAYTYDASGRKLTTTDPRGNATTYAYDTRGRRTAITDALGNTATTRYDLVGNVVAVTDPRGNTTRYAYDARDRLVATTDALGNTTRTYYDLAGNVVRVVDALGNETRYAYDALNRQVATTDALGNVATTTYDAAGNIAAHTDPLGRTSTFAYDKLHRVVQATDPAGNTVTTQYDATGNVVAVTDLRGQTTHYAYDALGRRVATTNPLGQTTTWAYDTAGHLVAITDPLGGTTQIQRDPQGRQTSLTDPLGNTETTEYDAAGNMVAFTDKLGRKTQYAYDALNRCTTITDPLGHTTTTAYDAVGNITAITDKRGNTTTYLYDQLNRRTAATDPLGNTETTEYDALGRIVATTDALGNTMRRTYDALGRVVRITDPLGNVLEFRYDAVGNVVAATDALGRTTLHQFDDLDMLTTITDPLGGTTTMTYDPAGNLLSRTDPRGFTTTFAYDALGRPVSTTDPLGNTTTTTYDALGNVATITDAKGNATTYAYDALGRRTLLTDALGNTLATAYDAVGNIIAQTDPRGFTTTFAYDALDRLATITDPLGNTTTNAYDEAGNLIAITDALGRTRHFAYDALARKTANTDPLGNTETIEYDAVGNRIRLTDALGNTTQFAYDAMRRLVAETDALGNSTTIEYDAAGNVVRSTDPLGNSTTFAYDPLDRLVATTDPLGNSTTKEYDATGNLTKETDALGRATSYAYDPLGRLTTVTDPLGNTTTTAYDELGNIVSLTDALGHTTTYAYDALGRQTTITDPLGNTQTTTYDAAGNVIYLTDERGFTTTYAYDPLGRLTTVTDPLGHATTTTYDAVGNPVAITDPLGHTTTYAYNALNRLTALTDAKGNTTTTTFDPVGNVASVTDPLGNTTTYSYDALGRQTAVTDALGGIATTTYDAAGNVVARTDPPGNTTTYAYDPLGRLVATTDALGNITTNAYDAVGNLVSVTDPLGHTTTYAYDEVNRRVAATDALGQTTTMVFDALDNLVSITDPLGRTALYAYDALGRQTAFTDPLGNTTTYAYDERGHLVAITDPVGHTTTYAYDAVGNQVSTTDPLGNTTTTAYDAVGNIVSVTDPLGHTTTTTYDELNRPLTLTDALGNTTTTAYDEAGNVVAVTDALGHTTTFAYDALNRRTATTDPLGNTTTTAYDAAGNVTAITDPRGHTTTFAHDAINRPVSVTDPLGGTTTTTYDAAGNTTAVTDPLGHTTTYAYDALNRLTTVTDPLGNATTTAYDAVGNAIATTDALGNTTTRTYDALDRQTAITDPLGGTTTTVYDAAGNVVSITDPLGHTTTFTYDALNRQASITDPLGNTSTIAYDATGNIASTTNALGHTTTFAYDALNRPVSVTDPLGHTTTTAYDALGNIVSTTDPMGFATTYAYDAAGRQVSATDPLGHTTTTEYDPAGNVAAIVDPAGNRTTFAHDALDRLATATNASGHTHTYAYDAAGNLVSVVDRNGRTIEFAHDAANRVVQERWLDGATPIHTIAYTYDATGRRLSATDPDATIAYTYDAAGRNVRVDNAGTPDTPHVVLDLAYDTAGNLISVADTIDGTPAATRAFLYDAANRLVQITEQGTAAADKRVAFAYDAANNLVATDRFDALFGNPTPIHTEYTYDAAERLTAIVHSRDGAQLANYQLTRDDNGRITRIVNADGTADFAYDHAGQLVAATFSYQGDQNFAYDPAGNRANPGHITGTDNRLLADGTYTYLYDNEGNRIRRTETATGEVTEYQWDHRNRLVRVVTKDSGGTVLATADYTYDPLGRRIARRVDPDGDGPDPAATTRFVHNGAHVLLQFDDAGTLAHRYLHGLEADQVLADDDGSGSFLWTLTDHLGTVADLVGPDGTSADHRTYGAFGTLTSQTNPGLDHLFAYAGRERDAETGLYYYRARYYDPTLGRFLSEDPVAFESRDFNLYRYVRNDPLDATDPTGRYIVPEELQPTGQGGLAGIVYYGARALDPGLEAFYWATASSSALDYLRPQAAGFQDIIPAGAISRGHGEGPAVRALEEPEPQAPRLGYVARRTPTEANATQAPAPPTEPPQLFQGPDVLSPEDAYRIYGIEPWDVRDGGAQEPRRGEVGALGTPADIFAPRFDDIIFDFETPRPALFPAITWPIPFSAGRWDGGLNDNSANIRPTGYDETYGYDDDYPEAPPPNLTAHDKAAMGRQLVEELRKQGTLKPRLESALDEIIAALEERGFRAAAEVVQDKLDYFAQRYRNCLKAHEQIQAYKQEEARWRQYSSEMNIPSLANFFDDPAYNTVAQLTATGHLLQEGWDYYAGAAVELYGPYATQLLPRQTTQQVQRGLENLGWAAKYYYEQLTTPEERKQLEFVASVASDVLGSAASAASRMANAAIEKWDAQMHRAVDYHVEHGNYLAAAIPALLTKENLPKTVDTLLLLSGSGNIAKALHATRINPLASLALAGRKATKEAIKFAAAEGQVHAEVKALGQALKGQIRKKPLISEETAIVASKYADKVGRGIESVANSSADPLKGLFKDLREIGRKPPRAGAPGKLISLSQAEEFGLHPEHFKSLQNYAHDTNTISIIRRSKKAGVPHIRDYMDNPTNPKATPKPRLRKDKTDPVTGLTEDGAHFPDMDVAGIYHAPQANVSPYQKLRALFGRGQSSRDMPGNLAKLEGPQGTLLNPTDYDDTMQYLNQQFQVPMVQHRPHDEWWARNFPLFSKGAYGPPTKLIAFTPDKRAFYLETLDEARDFYKHFGIDHDLLYTPNIQNQVFFKAAYFGTRSILDPGGPNDFPTP